MWRATDLPESRRRAAESRWNPAADVVESGLGSASEERGRRAVWGGKLLKRSLQKHGVADGWTPAPAPPDFDRCGSFRVRDSTTSRMNGHGSISADSESLLHGRKDGQRIEESFVFVNPQYICVFLFLHLLTICKCLEGECRLHRSAVF